LLSHAAKCSVSGGHALRPSLEHIMAVLHTYYYHRGGQKS
jgi:hypothetical protein